MGSVKLKLSVILLVLLIYTCVLATTADGEIKKDTQDVGIENNKPDEKQNIKSMENLELININLEDLEDSNEDILKENEETKGLDSSEENINSEIEDIILKEGTVISERKTFVSDREEFDSVEDSDNSNVAVDSEPKENSGKEVDSEKELNSEKEVVSSAESPGVGKETGESHEADTDTKHDEEEAEEPFKPIIINKVLVVKDNVSGHKHSSFSEDKSSNRGDEKTSAQVKEEAMKRIMEKEMEKEMLKEEENNEENVQSGNKSPDEVHTGGADEPAEESEDLEAEDEDDESLTESEKPANSLTQPDASSVIKDDRITQSEVSSGTKVEITGNENDAKVDDNLKSTVNSENDATVKESPKETEKHEEQPDKEKDNPDNEVIHSESLDEKIKRLDDKIKSLPSETYLYDETSKSKTTIKSDFKLISKEIIDTIKTPEGVEEVVHHEVTYADKEGKETAPVKKSVPKKEKKIQPGADLYNKAVELLKAGKKDVKKAYKLLAEAADMNNTDAAEKIAYPYLFGDNIKRNKTRAIHLFHSMAEKGIPLGQQGLGFVYGAGLNVNSSQAKALIYTTFGGLGGNAMAHMMLGYRYFNGIGVAKSCESALTHYKKVAKKVTDETTSHGGNAVQRVRLYDELEQPGGTSAQIDEDLLQYYQFLADKGDLQAQVGLGQLYFQGGRGIDVNYEKAFKYFQLAGDVDNGNGLAYLGKMYLDGLHVEKDQKKAFDYFTKAAAQSNPIGQAGLGMIYLKGAGVQKDYDQAMKYFSQAAEQGWVEGQLQLGNMYYNGIGVKKDYRQAVKYFTFASQSGHVMAFYNLASMHATGAGVMRSCNTAAELFKNVAERGKWSMMFMDAYDSYRVGDLETALLKYYYLAELGYEVAQSNVAYVLEKGELSWFSQNQTYARALLQWSRAAAQGYAVARVKVGDYHFYGYGTKIDYDTAALHYRMASDQQNNPQAMFNLGYMHEQGFGLKEDIHLAKRFYDMAAEASPDAHFPVTLALLKLSMHFTLEWMQNNYRFWEYAPFEHFKLFTLQKLGPDWDMYLITVLAILLGGLLLFRRTLRR